MGGHRAGKGPAGKGPGREGPMPDRTRRDRRGPVRAHALTFRAKAHLTTGVAGTASTAFMAATIPAMVARWARPGRSNWVWPTSPPSRAKPTTPIALAANAVNGGIHHEVRRIPVCNMPTPNPTRLSTNADRPNGVCNVRSASSPATKPVTAPFSGPATSPASTATSSMASGRTRWTWIPASTQVWTRRTTRSTKGTFIRGISGGSPWEPLQHLHEVQPGDVDYRAEGDVLLHRSRRRVDRRELADRDPRREPALLQPARHHRIADLHRMVGPGVHEIDPQRLARPGPGGHAVVALGRPVRRRLVDLHAHARPRIGQQDHRRTAP